MPIHNYSFLQPEVLVCKKCGYPVEKGFSEGFSCWYSCKKCNCWVMAVLWKKQEIT